MKYYIKENLININFRKSYIGSGVEVKVYAYGEYVIKLYKRMPNVFEKQTKHTLSSIPTKRIIMPIDFIYDEKEQEKGYTSKYIKKRTDTNSNINTNTLYNNLIQLKQDLELLSKYNINATDCHIDNIIFDKYGNLFIVDVGHFTSSYIENGAVSVNRLTFNYVIKCIIRDTISSTYKVSYDSNNNISDVIIGNKSISLININDYLEENIGCNGLKFFKKQVLECETLGEYHKNLIKKLTK